MEAFTFWLALISHSTMKSAISAVTKSAYATFHAPPDRWSEEWRMRTSTLEAVSSGRLSLGIGRLWDIGLEHGWNFGFPLDGDLHIEERGTQFHGHRPARVLYGQNGIRNAGSFRTGS